MKLFACALLACLPSIPAHAVNKCTGPDGKVVYQDAPCAGKGEAITVRPASGSGEATAAADAQGRIDAMRAENDMAAAIREKRPMVGMTVKQLNEAMGLATLVNTDMSTGTMREQAIFERPTETWYVYTRNGRVESFQHRPGPPIGHGGRHQRNAKAGPCPSAHEINNAITSASSISLTPEEREGRWRVIREMQACR
ncbi:DUF4124 domain-containing protein [Pulveribacter sp.]|uniref:DUF4124 domain-containing protein n=1 Tax=Pulveribacter sp. TaxID=2678893 RepID=UPI00289F42EB|nr:DUF4124 domain-containing protein [Pulveribacter sp.]